MATSAGGRRIENDTSLEALADVFKCFICMEQLDNARMCPHCSKLCCFECICKWITENKAQCPHCRRTLYTHALINCRWADDVIQQLDRLKNADENLTLKTPDSNTDLCESHSERLTVYCTTCDRVICHRCALFDGRHGQHTFRPLDDVYQEHVDAIKSEMDKLKSRRNEVQRLIDDVGDNILILNARKESRVEEIKKVVESIILRLESRHTSKLSTLTAQRNHLTQETELLNSLLHEVEAQLSSTTPANLIFRSPALSAMFAEVHKTPMPSVNCDYSPYDFASELVPPYATGEFVIHGFSRVRQRAEPIYSPPLECGALKWRLKVYPNGNGIVRGQYLSVFLEMTAGRREPSKYEYYIQLMHRGPPQDNAKCIAREFASDFAVGECWGYNRFIRLDLLGSEGYVSSLDDCLCFNYMVRPQTYQQQCRDYLWYITQLEDQKEQLREQIRRLDTQLRRQRCFSASTFATALSNEQPGSFLLGDSQGLSIVGEGDCGDALHLSITSERCPAPTPATAVAGPATPSGISEEEARGGENTVLTSTPLNVHEEETHEADTQVGSEGINDFDSDTDVDSEDCESDMGGLVLNILPDEVRSQEGEEDGAEGMSVDEQEGEERTGNLERQQRDQEEDFNKSGVKHSLYAQVPTLVDADFVTVPQSNGSNNFGDVGGNQLSNSPMRCDMRQLFYHYLKIAPRWISRGSSAGASSTRAAEYTEQLLQRISARLSVVEQGKAEESERGTSVGMAQLNTNGGEDEYRSEVVYGLLHSLQKLKLLRSNSDLFSNIDVSRNNAFHDIFGDVFLRQRPDDGDADQTLDGERRPRGQRSASVSRLSGSTVTSRLADERVRGRPETDLLLSDPLPSNGDLFTSRSSPLDLSVPSPSTSLSTDACVNLDIIRKRIREFQDGAIAHAPILADSTPNRSSDSEHESDAFRVTVQETAISFDLTVKEK
ncbi:E3 ubiquitin protein ligase TRIM37 [Echinococcus multilocularis]|uniref:E3 ubiquitin protein ligase TRIM37 n=1 Tax=Echinococcus multilocularis TaxID=6211 RepID=A0A068Y4U1_ECHMU|nr:E3 ubiquitin protein ligase TRIM37 [Echinococcus multilocularis]